MDNIINEKNLSESEMSDEEEEICEIKYKGTRKIKIKDFYFTPNFLIKKYNVYSR